MGRILGNAVASVDREAGPDTRVCLERLAKEAERQDSVISGLRRSLADSGGGGGEEEFLGTVTNTGGDLDNDLVVLGAGGPDVKTLPTTLTGKFLRDDSTWVAIPGGGDALTSSPLSQFAATTSAQLAGVLSDETGSGAAVFATSPALVTPVLGVATATSVNKVAITAPATGSTLTIQEGFTLTVSANATVSGTNTGDQTVPVKATGSEINTGTDDAKFATAKAITDSNVAFTSDIPSMATIAAAMYPVGSIYCAVVSTDPATLLGMGTWAAFGAGRVMVGLNSGDTDFDTVEETGGAKTVAAAGSNAAEATHTHTYTQTLDHVHTVNVGSANDTSTVTGAGNSFAGTTSSIIATTANPTGSAGATGTTSAGASHNHTFTGSATSVVQPYIVVYMWKRTA